MISHGSRSTYFWPILRLTAFLLCVATVAGFAGRAGWILDLCSNFRLQYLLLLLLLCVAFLVGRKGGMMLLTAAFALANLWPVASFYIPPGFRTVVPSSPGVRMLFVLLPGRSGEIDSLVGLVRSGAIGIVAVAGIDADGLARLQQLLPEHRYSHARPREDEYGVAVLSRNPLERGRVATVGRMKSPVVVVRCRVPRGTITVVAGRLLEGWGPAAWAERNAQLADLGTLVAGEKGDLVLLAALETTPWSTWFADLLARGHLVDGREGKGVTATWPRWMRGCGIPLDHLLFSGDLAIDDLQAISARWLDHRPLIATVRQRNLRMK